MDYDFPPYRPPNEASSALIRASQGCPWNRCVFCTMYKDLRFRPRPLQEIKRDVDSAVQIFPGAQSVFIADSDSLAMKDIEEALRHIKIRFPSARRITSYARAKTLLNLGVERLSRLRRIGLTRVHIGLESGDAETLRFLKKGATPEEMITGGRAAREAGLEVCLYVLIGAGGKDRLKEHAVESARVCNEINPEFIRLRTLIVQHGSPLEGLMHAGLYKATSPLEKLREVHVFLENLEVRNTVLASDHHTNRIWVDGMVVYPGIQGLLPLEKHRMLRVVDEAVQKVSSAKGEVLDATILYERGVITSL